ncbi:MAG TPA: FUSC family protein, partial [Steroidobacteraceae bacterium]|nr:FUSC family protein [Steroidobacteraceae bacterium]
VCLALLIAFWLQLDNPYWAGTSAGIVAQPALGASLRKGRFRAIGTVMGGAAIVVLTAMFPQNHLALLFGLAVWGAACGFFATILPNFGGYAAALAGYTTAIVFGDLVADPQNVFMQAVWRVTEIAIGILAAELIHALTDFGHARARLARVLADAGRDTASGLMQTLRTAHDPSEVRTLRRALIRRVIALDAIIEEAVGEPSNLRHQAAPLRAAQEALFVALSAWRGIANHLWTMPRQAANAIAAELLPRIAKLAHSSWVEDPQVARQICREETQIAGSLATTDVSSRLVQEGTMRTLRALEGVADALVLASGSVSQSSSSVSQSSSQHSYRLQVPDFLPPILNGVRFLVALLIAELFWILTEWPDGPTLITFTALSVILFSIRADTAFSSAVEFAVGCAGASVVAVILNQAVLPVVPSDFLALAVVLFSVLVPLGVLAAGTWHKTAFAGMVTNVMPILAIQNEPSYEATRVLNTGLAVVAGTVLAAIAIGLLPPLPPARRIRRLLMLTLGDLRGLLVGHRRFTQQMWVRLVSNRLAVLPVQATLEQEAQLVAALSAGEAAITLRGARPYPSVGRMLDQAFVELAEANVAAAHERLTRFSAHQVTEAEVEPQRALQAAVQATLLADALDRHPLFFSRTR